MDWFELYQFGNLAQGPNDDPDKDGFSNKREGELGQEATIFDLVEDGGIAGRLSTGVLYFQQQNRPPSNLELNSNFAYLNKEANQTIGTFLPTDPDDPNLYAPMISHWWMEMDPLIMPSLIFPVCNCRR